MKCNLLFELWTFLRLDVVYGEVMRRMPGPIHWLMWQVAKDTYLASKRDLLTWQKRPTYLAKKERPTYLAKERPTYLAKETYVPSKRDPLTSQKRPTYLAKETYLPRKRNLLT